MGGIIGERKLSKYVWWKARSAEMLAFLISISQLDLSVLYLCRLSSSSCAGFVFVEEVIPIHITHFSY